MAYQGNSIVDYLGSVGQDSSYTNRAKIAASKGIQNYSGTSAQNTQLLNTLRSGSSYSSILNTGQGAATAPNLVVPGTSLPASPTPPPTPLPTPTIVPQLQAAGATPSQAPQIAQQVQNGNTTPTGVPTNMPSIMGTQSAPTTTSTIPVSKLSTDSTKTTADILGKTVGGTGTDATSAAAGVSALYDQLSAPELKKYNDVATTVQTLQTQLGAESQDYKDALAQMGIPAAYQQIQSLNIKAAQLKGEIDTFDAETEQGKSNIENQQIPLGLVQGQQAQFEKQRNLTKLVKVAQMQATIGLSEAYKGNIDTGLDLMKQSIDLKYAPIKNQIDLANSQLDVAGKLLDRTDSRTATIVKSLMENQKLEIDTKIKNETDLNTLGAQAAAAGAPLSLVQAAIDTGDKITASSILNKYLHAVGEPSTGGTSGGTFTKTQLNNGAENAGVDLNAFGALPYEVKNFFVNAPAATLKAVQDNMAELQNTGDIEGFNATIDSSSLSAGVKSYLKQQAQQYANPGSGGGNSGGGFGSLGSTIKTIGSGIGSAWGAITNWLTGK